MTIPPPTIEILTPPGRGAVAVVRCDGDPAILDGSETALPLCQARDGRPFSGRPLDRITFARWGREHPEDVVICRTGNSSFEVHCHGGRAAVERIRRDLAAAFSAASLAPPAGQEVLADRDASRTRPLPADADLLTAAWDAVSRATTLRTADLLLHQAAVAWPAAIAEVERLDAIERRAWAARSLAWTTFGRHLSEPWKVALVGRPNAGKSSLMNALAGFQRSIVNPTPGTTRDAVTLDVSFDGWPIRLIDTAGLREGADELEAAGIDRARRVMDDADLVVHVCDVTDSIEEPFAGALRVANKIDLASEGPLQAVDSLPVSALTGAGLPALIGKIIAQLIPLEPAARQAIPVCKLHVEWLRHLE